MDIKYLMRARPDNTGKTIKPATKIIIKEDKILELYKGWVIDELTTNKEKDGNYKKIELTLVKLPEEEKRDKGIKKWIRSKL